MNNTRIYNLSSVPQITRFLLADAIISSKTNQWSDTSVVVARGRRDVMVKVKNNETVSTIL